MCVCVFVGFPRAHKGEMHAARGTLRWIDVCCICVACLMRILIHYPPSSARPSRHHHHHHRLRNQRAVIDSGTHPRGIIYFFQLPAHTHAQHARINYDRRTGRMDQYRITRLDRVAMARRYGNGARFLCSFDRTVYDMRAGDRMPTIICCDDVPFNSVSYDSASLWSGRMTSSSNSSGSSSDSNRPGM